MLHVPVNIRQIPSPALSPTVEQKDFIPREDSTPIVVDSIQQVPFTESPMTVSPPIGSPNLQSNILTQSLDASQVKLIYFFLPSSNIFSVHQNYPIFITNETTSPDLGSPIVSVSTLNPQLKPQDIDEQMERFSETSSIELIIQGGNYEQPSMASHPMKVPESHLMQFNHYPGSKNSHVPVDILKSFAPVANPNEPQQQEGADIYSDYIQDPYNLTLQMEGVRNQSAIVTSASTVFQSSSYFSNDANESVPELFKRP